MSLPIFLYGTLRDLSLLETLLGRRVQACDSMLTDHRVETEAEGVLPMLMHHPGGTAQGICLTDLSPVERERLVAYEAAFGYELQLVDVDTNSDQALPAEAFFPPATQASSGALWMLEAWPDDARRVAHFAAEEIAAHEPPLSAVALAKQWKQIGARAWAKLRASKGGAPATMRYKPAAGDMASKKMGGLDGAFYKFGSMSVSHRQFDGTPSSDLQREGFFGFDAAIVLPFDPVLDRVLLVEQFRVGPYLRSDANPWMLEPVAGMVDAGEFPQDAARRELAEEAGISIAELVQMFNFYPSPGGTTEHFYCYLGVCDLSYVQQFGGMPHEAEDLRLHSIDRTDALNLIETGELSAGPIIAMLYWLDRNLDRF